MEAKITNEQPDTSYVLEVNGHRLQVGGRDGDGFCYGHGSFDCELSAEERLAEDAAYASHDWKF